MGYVLLGIAALVFLAGVGAQLAYAAVFAPGAGDQGMADSLAVQTAEAVAVYASGCMAAAASNPGVIGNLQVSMNADGATVVLPADASCVTTAGPSGGRYVFASAKLERGMAAYLMKTTQGSTLWHQVITQGQAVSLSGGIVAAVPAAIPAGSILNWSQVSH